MRNLTVLMVRMSDHTTILRYSGSTDTGYLSFDGSSTVSLGRRVVFPTIAFGLGPYIRSAVRTSDDVTGQFKITLASKTLLKFRVGTDKQASLLILELSQPSFSIFSCSSACWLPRTLVLRRILFVVVCLTPFLNVFFHRVYNDGYEYL